MARLGKIQIYAIRWLNSQGKTSEAIADELNLSENQVKKTLEQNSSTNNNNANIKTAKSPANKVQNLMITETSNKKTKNVAIMTKEASELNDQLKNQSSIHPMTEKAIFRPRQK